LSVHVTRSHKVNDEIVEFDEMVMKVQQEDQSGLDHVFAVAVRKDNLLASQVKIGLELSVAESAVE
jgi:hypothetical protein